MGSKETPAHKSKVQSKKSPKFVDPGPSGKMHRYKGAGPQPPGVSSQEGSGGGPFPKGGGSGRMSKKNTVKNATAA